MIEVYAERFRYQICNKETGKKCAKDRKSFVGDHGEEGIYNCKAKQSPVVYTCAIGNWVRNDKAIAIKAYTHGVKRKT